MTAQAYRITTLGILLAFSTGCGGQTDLTQTLEAQRSGLLGRWYQLPSDSDLIKRYSRFVLVAPNDPLWQNAKRIGKVDAGTRLVSCRLIRATDLVAFMVFPVTHTHDCVLGMIVDGPHAGEEIDLSDPFGAKLDPARIPATQPFPSDRRYNPPMERTGGA